MTMDYNIFFCSDDLYDADDESDVEVQHGSGR